MGLTVNVKIKNFAYPITQTDSNFTSLILVKIEIIYEYAEGL